MKQYINIQRKIFKIFLYGFAIVGFLFFGVYVAMQLHLTNVAGSIDSRNAFFNTNNKNTNNIVKIMNSFNKSSYLDSVTICKIMTVNSILPNNGKIIFDTYTNTHSVALIDKMIQAILLVTPSNAFLHDKINNCDSSVNNFINKFNTPSNQAIFDWEASIEWQALHDALVKDKDIILKASIDSGVPTRVIVSTVISEQFRFFTANRESFKKYFEPLKILGNGTKFSYGIAGVKIETAQEIENNLKNTESPFYLGLDYENILDYSDKDPDSERFLRLTDDKNHYYSYLYTAIFLKEIIHQWHQYGYDIEDRPEVLATLFNLGFAKSIPKPTPEVGGSTITINDRDYTFGGLAYEFYYSGELSDIFPFDLN